MLAVENMASDADVKAVLDVIGLDAAVDRKAQTVQFVTDAEHVLGIITRLNEAGWKASVKSTKTDTGIKKDENSRTRVLERLSCLPLARKPWNLRVHSPSGP